MRLYTKIYKIGEDKKNIGFNYTDKLLKRNMSSYVYNNSNIKWFVDSLDLAITKLYNLTKIANNFHNYTVNKDETNIS